MHWVLQAQTKLPDNLQLAIDHAKTPVEYVTAYRAAGEFHYVKFNAEGYAKAVSYFEKGRIKANESKDSVLIGITYLTLGSVYDAIGGDQLQKALSYYTIHQRTAIKIKDTLMIVRAYINIANVQQKMNLFRACEETLAKLTLIAKQYHQQSTINRANVYAAFLSSEMNLAEKSKMYFSAIDLHADTLTNDTLAFKKIYQLTQMYLLQSEGKYTQAIAYGKSVFASNPNLADSIIICNKLSEYAEKAKAYQIAYEFRTTQNTLYNQLINLKAKINVNNQLLRSELALKEENAALLLVEEKNQEKQKKWLLIGLSTLFIAFISILVLARDRIKRNELLAEQVIENKNLLQEVHHRVKNNLQIVSSFMMLQQLKKETNTADLLKQLQSKIQALALIHQKLHQQTNFDTIQLHSYLDSLVEETLNIHIEQRENVTFEVEADDCALNLDIVTPLALLTIELLLNTIKYVATKQVCHILIRAKKNADQLHFSYEDNGPGLPDSLTIETAKTTGLRLVKKLAKQIKSKPILDPTHAGLRFTFEIPL
jgi:two-component system, sensor histidine kinase PdtaS